MLDYASLSRSYRVSSMSFWSLRSLDSACIAFSLALLSSISNCCTYCLSTYFVNCNAFILSSSSIFSIMPISVSLSFSLFNSSLFCLIWISVFCKYYSSSSADCLRFTWSCSSWFLDLSWSIPLLIWSISRRRKLRAAMFWASFSCRLTNCPLYLASTYFWRVASFNLYYAFSLLSNLIFYLIVLNCAISFALLLRSNSSMESLAPNRGFAIGLTSLDRRPTLLKSAISLRNASRRWLYHGMTYFIVTLWCYILTIR